MTVIALATPHPRHDSLEAELAVKQGLTVARFRNKTDLTASSLRAISPRYVFFPHWSWKVPADIFENFECVIFHMTDVPFGRGGSPLQNLVVRGFTNTKVTALRCVAEMDAGDVYMKQDMSLEGTAEEILRRAADITCAMIKVIVTDNPVPTPQYGQPTLFKRRAPEDGNISGLTEPSQIYDYIRMLDADGYPPAFVEVGGLRLEFSRGRLKADSVEANVRITCRKS
jgi:methionyl-tRNA formyltransferase